MKRNCTTIAITTTHWRPGHAYLRTIQSALVQRLQIQDVVVVSEKAISVAEGNIIDEKPIRPGLTARLMARVWMRLVWGYVLGPICHLSELTIRRLRSYPLSEGAAHKQIAVDRVGLLDALRHGSEGGIDVSNLPYSYASLPLKHPEVAASKIFEAARKDSFDDFSVLIVDSDKTYTWRNLHFSARSTSIRGILPLGILGYVLGRSLRLRARSTPIAQAGHQLGAEEALRIAAIANRARGSGSGRTAWDMAETFEVGLTEVTWESLSKIRHRPIVIVRRRLN